MLMVEVELNFPFSARVLGAMSAPPRLCPTPENNRICGPDRRPQRSHNYTVAIGSIEIYISMIGSRATELAGWVVAILQCAAGYSSRMI